MKTNFATILCLAVLLSACKKHQVNPTKTTISGTWELRATKGGNILPATFPHGNGHLITFGDSIYRYYSSDTLATQGHFQQYTDNQGNPSLTFSSGDLKSDLGVIQKDTLVIKPFNPDAASSYYVQSPPPF